MRPLDVIAQMTINQLADLVAKLEADLGRDIVQKLLSGRVSLSLVLENIEVQPAAIPVQKVVVEVADDDGLVCANGVFSARGILANVARIKESFSLSKPVLDLQYCELLLEFLAFAFECAFPISANELLDRIEKVKAELLADESMKYLVCGKYACPLATVIPQTPKGDYGKNLWKKYLPAFARANSRLNAKNRKFIDSRHESLIGQVKVLPGTGHEKVVELAEKGFVPGLFFPNALQGWSVSAQLEFFASQPGSIFPITLGGGLDTFSAWAGNLGLTEESFVIRGQSMSALCWRKPSNSLFLHFNTEETYFGSRGRGSIANQAYSGGVFLTI